MHTFLDHLQQGGKYSNQVTNHKEELKREENIVDKNKFLYPIYKLII